MDLFCALNPKLKQQQLDTFCWPKLWLGFYVNNAGEWLHAGFSIVCVSSRQTVAMFVVDKARF